MSITMPRKIELTLKHAKKFASKSAATPVLNGIHYAADGSVCVTDRYRLLRIRDAHAYTTPFTSDAKTGATIDGVYPDLSRAIPQANGKTTLTLSGANVANALSFAKLALDTAKAVGDKRNLATLRVDGKTAVLSVTSGGGAVSFSVRLEADVSGEDAVIALNAEFWYDAWNVFKDAGSASVTVNLHGTTAPIVLTDATNGIDVVVLPYRLPSEGGAV